MKIFNKAPKASIVLPTHNGETYLSESIESVLNQTFKDFELIIVNDASTDRTLEIAQEYSKKDSRIKILSHKENKGISETINDGFDISSGEYRSWTSDDNYYSPDALMEMVNYLDSRPDCDMVYTTFTVRNQIENIEKIVRTPISPLHMIDLDPCGACFLYRTSIAKKIGGYDKTYPLVQDYEYWLRMYLEGNIEYLDKNLYTWRFHDDCQSEKFSYELQEENLLLRDKYLPLYKEKFFEETSEYVDNYLRQRRLTKAVIAAEEQNDLYFSKKIMDEFSKEEIFVELKSRYKRLKHEFYLKAINRLGFKYFLNAIYLKNKYAGEKK